MRRGDLITPLEVAEIHRLRAVEGATQVEIASLVGRAQGTVSRALRVLPADWPTPSDRRPPPAADAAAAATKHARARVRADLTTGRRSLADVLEPPDPVIADLALADVVRMQWRNAGRRAVPALERLGRRAVRDGVNLMMASGRASAYSRAWVAEHGSKWARPKTVAS